MEVLPLFIGFYLMPILAIIFCINLVEVMKKVKKEQPTTKNTFWLAASFASIVWTIAALVIATS